MRAKRLPSSLRRNFDWHLFVARRNLSFAEKPGGATHAYCLSTVQHVGKRAPKFVAEVLPNGAYGYRTKPEQTATILLPN
jgi:hypothetical protein